MVKIRVRYNIVSKIFLENIYIFLSNSRISNIRIIPVLVIIVNEANDNNCKILDSLEKGSTCKYHYSLFSFRAEFGHRNYQREEKKKGKKKRVTS